MADISKRATELVIALEDCPWCKASPGELCYAEGQQNEIVRHWSYTHIGRFPTDISPEAYIEEKQNDS